MKRKVALIILCSIGMVSCSHSAKRAKTCGEELSGFTYDVLDGGFFHSDKTRQASVEEIKGQWRLIGHYNKAEEARHNSFDLKGLDYAPYARADFQAGKSRKDFGVTFSSSETKGEKYRVQLMGDLVKAIEFGLNETVEQPVRILKQCDSLLVRWNTDGMRADYLLFGRK